MSKMYRRGRGVLQRETLDDVERFILECGIVWYCVVLCCIVWYCVYRTSVVGKSVGGLCGGRPGVTARQVL